MVLSPIKNEMNRNEMGLKSAINVGYCKPRIVGAPTNDSPKLLWHFCVGNMLSGLSSLESKLPVWCIPFLDGHKSTCFLARPPCLLLKYAKIHTVLIPSAFVDGK